MNKIKYGRALSDAVTVAAPDAPFALPGVDEEGNLIHWPVDFDLLSGGVLLLGDAGTGKSNAMNLLARQIRRALGPDEIMIAFDAFGDLEKWSRPGDCVIDRDGWNIPEEAGGDRKIAQRLAEALTSECLPSYTWVFEQEFGDSETGLLLDAALTDNRTVVELLAQLLIECADTPALCRAIEKSAGSSGAARKLSDLSAEAFAGHLDGSEGISMRRFVREGGRALFVRSGFGNGQEEAACAMLSAAVHYAAQENRRAYVLLDDFVNLTKLTDRARRALLHAKNIVPIVCAQWMPDSAAMMRLFGTKILFRTSEASAREAFSDSCAVDCAEIVDFECGQAAVRCAHFAPFKFRFKKNPDRRS